MTGLGNCLNEAAKGIIEAIFGLADADGYNFWLRPDDNF